MSSTGDKMKGLAKEAQGKINQGVGRLIGNRKLEAEGILLKRKGQAQQAVGNAKDAIKSVIDKS
ncbi:MAG: CsbD family protein [Beijerinckiaceae bacterium]|nr:CsbD family protein [Beijerinckiaceae bacterium]MCZ8300369.1 CsbD family protein [Beijerinckiaceae bacterium]